VQCPPGLYSKNPRFLPRSAMSATSQRHRSDTWSPGEAEVTKVDGRRVEFEKCVEGYISTHSL
jgi:hypothetical protein